MIKLLSRKPTALRLVNPSAAKIKDRKSGSAGMPRPISYAVFCLKKKSYMKQQDREVEKLRKAESKRLPPEMKYKEMPELSREIVEKLTRIQPQSIAQASRIPGITPAAISILLFHLEMRRPQSVI